VYRVVTIGGLGDAAADAASASVSASIDPAKKAEFLNLAKTMPDDRAEDLADIVDATPYGSRQKLIRYGIGAVVGAALAAFVITPIAGTLFTRAYGGKKR
jgi:hypothetical protein